MGDAEGGCQVSKPYHRKMSPLWFLQRPNYIKFMIREITSVFVAIFVLELLCMVLQIAKGPTAFTEFVDFLKKGPVIAFHIVALLFALFHTCTWFNLVPQAMPVRIGEDKVPGVLLAGAHYVGWLVVSAVMAWFILK
jgi:fumarate reductase subunit C